jgi:4-hydroxy-tetrahydrodipicolinate synthase
MHSKFRGTGVALVTPFNEDFSVDYSGLERLLDLTIREGADYLVVNGTTAESPTTTETEKNAILSFVVNHAKGKPVVYGLGGNNTSELITKLGKLEKAGVDAILSVSPYYNKPSQEGIYQHYSTLAASTELPIILYNIPGRTGSNVSAKTTIRLSQIKNVIGTKEASGDFSQCLEIIKNTSSDFLLLSGDDMLAVPLISIGGQGVISVLANAFPRIFCQMIKDALNDDFSSAAKTLRSFVDINHLLYEEGNPVGLKTVLHYNKICNPLVRLPLVKASENLTKKIEEVLQKLEVN